jgi:CHRD domain-containing protein
MKHMKITVLASAVAMMAIVGIVALAVAHGDRGRSLRATLRGIEEPPSVITAASGEFKATISRDETSIDYELRYEDLQGTVTQAHIHVGQKGVNGGISVWLCGTATNPGPVGTPTCPAPNSGKVEGTITAANVTGPAGQGVAVGEFADLLKALRSGVTYANVHSSMFPGGEVRGQISVRDDDDDRHHR